MTDFKKEIIIKKKHNCLPECYEFLGPSDHSGSTEKARVMRDEIITLFLKFGFEVETAVPGKSFLKFLLPTNSNDIF